MGQAAKQEVGVNPWEATEFLSEAFAETLADMSESEKADLARAILSRHSMDWADMIGENVAVYMEDSVHNVKMGYRPVPKGEA